MFYEIVDSKKKARQAIASLSRDGLEAQLSGGGSRRAVAVDMEGDLTKDGSSSLLQIAGPRSGIVYLFDILACPGMLDKNEPLAKMLVGVTTTKVMHDCRADADALRGQFEIDLKNVWDTQSAEMVLTSSKSRVSLNKALEKHLGLRNKHKDSVKHRPGVWEQRPLPEKLLAYAAGDVRDCLALFVAQEGSMTAAQKTETMKQSAQQVAARIKTNATGSAHSKKATAASKKATTNERINATATAFFEYLATSRPKLRSIKTTTMLGEELAQWKEREEDEGRVWRGGPGPVVRSLYTDGLVRKSKEGRLFWTETAIDRTPPETKKAPKEKVSKKKAQLLAEAVRTERAQVERNKGGVVVEGPHQLCNVTAAPGAVLERDVIVRNEGDTARQIKCIALEAKKASAYTADFSLEGLPHFPCNLPPGTYLPFTIRCTMPRNPGSTSGLLSISMGSFAIGRILDVTCGNKKVLDSLKATSEYKPKKLRKKSTRDRVMTPPGVSSGQTPFSVQLGKYEAPSSWKESLRLGECGELLLRSRNLAPLSRKTYVARFSRLLWCEEDSQRENLELYSMEGASMRATASRLELLVEGLAEKRPSVLRGDFVDVSCALGHYRGVVETVERDRILLRFHPKLHGSHRPSTRYDIHFVFRRVPLRLAHQGLDNVAKLRPDLLFPTSNPGVEPVGLRYFNEALNEHQRIAVEHVVGGAGKAAPYLLYGPPGTGKTTTLVEMIAQTVDLSKKVKVLVMAPTNAAADVVCQRLHDIGGSPCGSSLAGDGKMLRMMAFSRSPKDVPGDVLKHATFSGREFRTPTSKELGKARVVVGTLTTVAKLHNLFQSLPRFDCVFIDEAGQALEPECIAPLATLMKRDGQVILAGDHQQLGPVVLSPTARTHGLALSYLERLSRMPPYQRNLRLFSNFCNGYNPHVISMLTINYRSHPDIIAVPNKLFYHDALQARGPQSLTHGLLRWNRLPNKKVPIIFHHLVGNNTRESSSPSWFNPDEAAQVLNYVQMLLREAKVQPQDIGIIAPYHKQVQKIKKALTLEGIEVGEFGLKVGSTEMFQGQERRVIIISTVRSDPSFLDMDQVHNLGFVANAKRFNVAVTRAQALLIVVGNANVLATDDNWAALLAHCKKKGAWKGETVRLPTDPKEEDPRFNPRYVDLEDEGSQRLLLALVARYEELFVTSF